MTMTLIYFIIYALATGSAAGILAYNYYDYGIMEPVILAVMVALVMILQYTAGKKRSFFNIPLILFIILIVFRFMNVQVSLEGTVLVLYSFIMNICSMLHKKHYLYLTPMIAAFCLILALTPVSDEPINWKGIIKMMENAGDNIGGKWEKFIEYTGIDEIIGEKSIAGYADSNDIIIADNIVGNNVIQLEIDGTQTKGSIYLRGSIYNEYKKGTWTKNYSEEAYPEYEMQLIENMLRLKRLEEEYPGISDRINIINYKIRYRHLKDKTYFLPYNAVTLMNDSDIIYKDQTLLYENERDDSYDVWCFGNFPENIGLKKGKLNERLNENLMPHEIWLAADFAKERFGISLLDNLKATGKNEEEIFEYGKRRQRYIKNNYLNNTGDFENVKDSIRSLMDDEGLNDFEGIEQLKNIEKFLSDNYTYSMKADNTASDETEAVSENEDAVVRFLMERKTGSCMHFASAFALMARVAGYPSRIVTGYCFSFNKNEGQRVTHMISGSNAHAWPEVYIDGVWKRFEPTGTYNEQSYSSESYNDDYFIGDDYVYDINEKLENAEELEEFNNPQTGTAMSITHDKYGKDRGDSDRAYGNSGKHDDRDTNTDTSTDTDKDSIVSRLTESRIFVYGVILFVIAMILLAVIIFLIPAMMIPIEEKKLRKCRRIIHKTMNRYNMAVRRKKTAGSLCNLNTMTLNETADIMASWLGDNEGAYRKLIEIYQAKIFGGVYLEQKDIDECGRKLV